MLAPLQQGPAPKRHGKSTGVVPPGGQTTECPTHAAGLPHGQTPCLSRRRRRRLGLLIGCSVRSARPNRPTRAGAVGRARRSREPTCSVGTPAGVDRDCPGRSDPQGATPSWRRGPDRCMENHQRPLRRTVSADTAQKRISGRRHAAARRAAPRDLPVQRARLRQPFALSRIQLRVRQPGGPAGQSRAGSKASATRLPLFPTCARADDLVGAASSSAEQEETGCRAVEASLGGAGCLGGVLVASGAGKWACPCFLTV